MSKLAIDVALLVDEAASNIVIALNKELLTGAEDEIVLGEKGGIPHVALAMGLMEEDKVPEISQRLEKIAGSYAPLDLVVQGVEVGPVRRDGRVISGLNVRKTDELQHLHERILTDIIARCTYEGVRTDMFYGTPAKLSEYWASGKVSTNIHAQFHPHITIGFGTLPPLEKPLALKASTLALCHLGAHSTCRKILAQCELNLGEQYNAAKNGD